MSHINLGNKNIDTMLQIENMIIIKIREIPYDHINQPQFANSKMIVANTLESLHDIRITHYKPNEIDLDINTLIGMTCTKASKFVINKIQKRYKTIQLLLKG